jgi:uncharacterized cupredoxin-like copper-binding protein
MARRGRLLGIAMAGVLAAFALGACGSSGDSAKGDTTAPTGSTGDTASTAPAEGTVVNVALGETDVQHQYMTLDSSSVPAGAVSFAITNEGVKNHEFVVLSSDLAADQLEMNGDEANEDAYTLIDEVEDIPGGETATLNVTLDPGHYVIICNIKGHYRMGMETELTVS